MAEVKGHRAPRRAAPRSCRSGVRLSDPHSLGSGCSAPATVAFLVSRVLRYCMSMDVSEVLKALADPNRLRMLNLLHEHALCVCDLKAVLQLNQSNLSRHLSRLKMAGIVKARKQSLFSYYAREELAQPYGSVVDSICEAIHGDPAWEADRVRLRQRLRLFLLLLHGDNLCRFAIQGFGLFRR